MKELRYPINWKLRGPREHVWTLCRIENLLLLPVCEPRTVLPVASRYTKYDISATASGRKKMIVGLRIFLPMKDLYHAASQSFNVFSVSV